MIKDIEQKAIEKYGSFRKFCIENGYDYSNFKRKLIANLNKINNWIEPLGLEIALKKRK